MVRHVSHPVHVALATCAAALICGAASGAGPSRISRLDRSVIDASQADRLVERLMAAGRVPGLGVAIFNQRKVAYLRTFGVRDSEKALPFTPNTVFNAASLTKATFAYAVMQLVQDHRLELDTPIATYLAEPWTIDPAFSALASDQRFKRITARMLLSHTAGFPNLRVLNKGQVNVNFDPGSRYAYSGEGFRLLQLVVERITRIPFERLMRERIFTPFGMKRTSMIWDATFESDSAIGYNTEGHPLSQRRRLQADAAGSMVTTLHDFSRFLEGVAQSRRINTRTRTAMLAQQIAIVSRRQFPTLSIETTDQHRSIGLGYGLGWGLFTTPVGHAFFKEGHDSGFQHYCVIFDDVGTGVLLVANSDNAEGLFGDLLNQLIADRYTPLEWEGYGLRRGQTPE